MRQVSRQGSGHHPGVFFLVFFFFHFQQKSSGSRELLQYSSLSA
jgi:hypothetical protein